MGIMRSLLTILGMVFPVILFGNSSQNEDCIVPPQPGIGHDMKDIVLSQSGRTGFLFRITDGDVPTFGEKAIPSFPPPNGPFKEGVSVYDNGKEISRLRFPANSNYHQRFSQDFSMFVCQQPENPDNLTMTSYTINLYDIPSGNSRLVYKPDYHVSKMWFKNNNDLLILGSLAQNCDDCTGTEKCKIIYHLETITTAGKVLSREPIELPQSDSHYSNCFVYSASENMLTLILVQKEPVGSDPIKSAVMQYSLDTKTWVKQAVYPVPLLVSIPTENENIIVFRTKPRQSDSTFGKFYQLDVRKPKELIFIGNFNSESNFQGYDTRNRTLYYHGIAGEVKKIKIDYQIITKNGQPRNYRMLSVKLPKFKHVPVEPLAE